MIRESDNLNKFGFKAQEQHDSTELSNSSDNSFFYGSSNDRRDNWKLKHALKIKGYREISEFAKVTNYGRSFISKVIHRHIKPTFNQAQEISSKLGLHIFDLFEATP